MDNDVDGEQKLLSYLKRVTAELQHTREQLCEERERGREPIAIIGMGCRYPGGVDSPEALWELVRAERDVVTGFPRDRGWKLDEVYDPDVTAVGTSYTAEGGFLDDVAGFDHEFFGVSEHEALAMDPQHRVALEVAWEAVERAMIDPAALTGSRTGVYVGGIIPDYGMGMTGMPPSIGGLAKTARLLSMLSGRISYALGLTGPSLTVDTACSSSLTAIHLACQALRAGDCALALAGGAMIYSTPEVFVEYSKLRLLARDGRCKSYAAAGDGIGWGEGAGVLFLERLSDARRNGHEVLAVIRGGAVTNDGPSNGMTAPSSRAQQQTVLAALSNAGMPANHVDVVEGHGTGTLLGDAIEVRALFEAYGTGRDRPLWLGSVKSNIAHTQAASGVAGVIKMVMAMRHGVLPRTLHVDAPVPHVDWSSGSVRLLTGAMAWPDTGRPRVAAVSGTGISGTSGHLLLEQAPAKPPAPALPDVEDLPWVISGRSQEALWEGARRLHDHLTAHPELRTCDVAYSLATTRSAFAHRAAVTAGDRAERLAALAALAAGPATGAGEPTGHHAAVVQAYLDGATVRWDQVFDGTGARRTTLPTSVFRRERFWLYDHEDDGADSVLVKEGVVELPAVMMAGMTVRTDNETELHGTARITDLWSAFLADGRGRSVPAERTLRAVYADYVTDHEGPFTYLLGYEFPDGERVPDGFETRTMPAGRYAVFRSERGPLQSVIANAYRQIWAMDAEELGGKRTYLADFEVFDTHDPKPQEVQLKIYVGLE
ncbi:beta-ketoacyl synthase N-terminal-like domain-containing protein [Lentzea jiangxiensis]|uniref:Erythronolide synthase docking n=1 Tax=Lentzea jiangxiensis TaxID=641025 RepID=A0A1H0X3M3_9PSEU|nr:beta-ketoacyl synthase N-terminal-like domain-containing protein [Lentzea jiangxiensis]SDP97553.1 Erythronolide synthase docking [Lentzea jiangxiensis]